MLVEREVARALVDRRRAGRCPRTPTRGRSRRGSRSGPPLTITLVDLELLAVLDWLDQLNVWAPVLTDEIVNETSLQWLTAGATETHRDEVEVQVPASCDSLMLSIGSEYGAPAAQLGLPADERRRRSFDEPAGDERAGDDRGDDPERGRAEVVRTRFGGELMGAWWALFTPKCSLSGG